MGILMGILMGIFIGILMGIFMMNSMRCLMTFLTVSCINIRFVLTPGMFRLHCQATPKTLSVVKVLLN